MKKFRLIREYPGSPYLGTICEERNNKSSFCYYFEGEKNIGIAKDQVENQPEYWEKVEDYIWWCVWEKDYDKDLVKLFRAWFAYKIECIPELNNDRHYFKTKEEAEQYIIKNKPCLTLNDVGLILGGLDKKRDVFLELKRIVKSRL